MRIPSMPGTAVAAPKHKVLQIQSCPKRGHRPHFPCGLLAINLATQTKCSPPLEALKLQNLDHMTMALYCHLATVKN